MCLPARSFGRGKMDGSEGVEGRERRRIEWKDVERGWTNSFNFYRVAVRLPSPINVNNNNDNDDNNNNGKVKRTGGRGRRKRRRWKTN